MTTTQELLKSSFELNLNNYGPEDVERLNDWAIKAYAALEALRAEVARLIRDRDSVWALKEHKEVLLSQMTSERDAALARLAEIEAQESVATVLLHEGEKIIDGTMAFMDTAWLGMPLFASAGASPVEPSQARELSEALENLIDATEGLMAWQVKNVKVWNNPAYDTAHMRIEQLRAAINAKGR